jgi:rhodanese-related sulfurtransferase
MASEIESISREQLCEKLERGDDLVLVDALPPISFAASRLPGAINIPPASVDERAPRRIPDRESKIVVYCQSPTCDASVDVAHRLIELGYENVRHYPGGKDEWRAAGLPLEGGRARTPSSPGQRQPG